MKDTAVKIYNNKFMKIAVNGLMVVLIAYAIKALTDMDSVPYQVYKDVAICKALIAVVLCIMILRKVRLFNIPSLVSVIAFVPLVVYQVSLHKGSPDLIQIDIYAGIVQLLVILTLVDLCIYKNIIKMSNLCLYMMVMFILLVMITMYYSFNTLEPVTILVSFGLLYITPLKIEEWENFCLRICDGFILSMIYLDGKSLIFFPYDGERYYGSFVNIGPYGMYHCCLLVLVIFGIIYTLKKHGWKHYRFFAGCGCLGFVMFMMYIINTRTLMAGIVFMLITWFLFLRKDTSAVKIVIRTAVIVGIVALGIFIIWRMSMVAQERYAYWKSVYEAEGATSFIHYNLFRVYRALVNQEYAEESMAYYTNPLLSFLDCISSYRIQIWEAFLRETKFSGQNLGGIQVGSYYAYNPHNMYIRSLSRYGFVGGSLYTLILFVGYIRTLKTYLKKKNIMNALPVIWLAMMFGVWWGEGANTFYPITFFGFVLIYPAMCKFINQDEVRYAYAFEKNKKGRIYVAHTFYHVYVSMLKEFALPESERGNATMVLSKMSNDFGNIGERLLKTGVFREVIDFDEKKDSEFPELMELKKDRGNIIPNMIQRIKYTGKLAKLESKYVPVNFKKYNEVYVFCDSDPIGVYLNKKRIPYHALEDGLDYLAGYNLAIYNNRGHFKLKKFFSEELNLIFICDGYSKYCIDMELNDISKVKYPYKKYREVRRSELEDRLTKEDKKLLIDAFVKDVDRIRKEVGQASNGKDNILILTEPLTPSLETREQIFRDLIAEYSKEGTIFLKPHPRDELDYPTVFADVLQFEGKVPMEILNFFEEVHFKKVVSVFTELGSIKFADEKVKLGRYFMDKYEDPEIHNQNEKI